MVVQVHVTYDKEGDNIQQAPAAIPGLRSNLSAIHQLLVITSKNHTITKFDSYSNYVDMFTCVLYIIITKGMKA